MSDSPSDQKPKPTVDNSYEYAKGKGWETTEKVKRYNRNLSHCIDQLGQFLPGFENASRIEILRAIYARLALMPNRLSPPAQTFHYLAAAFTQVLEIDGDKLLRIETAWEKLMALVSEVNPGVAETLNTAEFRAAFTWHLSGFSNAYMAITSPVDYVGIYQSNEEGGNAVIRSELILLNGIAFPSSLLKNSNFSVKGFAEREWFCIV